MAKTIVTHNSSFHTDDIFAVATLKLAFPEESFNVIRSRDPEIIDRGDIVVDVGSVYDQSKLRFDHHQTGGAGKRDNGIPYASFGLVWKEFGEKISGSKEVAHSIEERLVMGVDAIDNGVAIYTPIFENVFPFSITDFLMSYKGEGILTEEQLYKTFIELVEIAKGLIQREVEKEKIIELLRNEILSTYTNSVDKEIIILPRSVERHVWSPVLTKFPEPFFVVYQGLDKNWKAECVPQSIGNFSKRKSFPSSWGGKRGEELAQITGVPDAVFCHNGLFSSYARSKEGALTLAKIALKS